jgi:hypothetical protein
MPVFHTSVLARDIDEQLHYKGYSEVRFPDTGIRFEVRKGNGVIVHRGTYAHPMQSHWDPALDQTLFTVSFDNVKCRAVQEEGFEGMARFEVYSDGYDDQLEAYGYTSDYMRGVSPSPPTDRRKQALLLCQ